MKISISARTRPGKTALDRAYGELMCADADCFEHALSDILLPQKPYLTEVEYGMYRRGKKLRPLMLMLFARMTTSPGGALPDKVIKGAAALEMLHVATLIHDDIIDGAALRRGAPSVNAARGVGTAILIGDLQFLQSIRTFVGTINTQSDMGLVEMVLDTAFHICCGELDELRTDPAADRTALKKRYLETIDRKTAILFGLACESGVILADAPAADARRAGFYGRRVGRAFQVMDDIFDFLHSDEATGKTAGMDLANRRLSLPIVYALEILGEKSRVGAILHGAVPPTPAELADGVAEVTACGALERCYADARSYALEALEYLHYFPQNRYTHALRELALYVVDRGM